MTNLDKILKELNELKEKANEESINDLTELIVKDYKKHINKEKVEDTHKRTTFLIRKDLDEKVNNLCKNNKRGLKTRLFNLAIEKIIDNPNLEKMLKE